MGNRFPIFSRALSPVLGRRCWGFSCGFAALGGTPLIVYLGGDEQSGKNARSLQLCGCLLVLAAIPVLFLKVFRLTTPKDTVHKKETNISLKEITEANAQEEIKLEQNA